VGAPDNCLAMHLKPTACEHGRCAADKRNRSILIIESPSELTEATTCDRSDRLLVTGADSGRTKLLDDCDQANNMRVEFGQ